MNRVRFFTDMKSVRIRRIRVIRVPFAWMAGCFKNCASLLIMPHILFAGLKIMVPMLFFNRRAGFKYIN